MMIAVRCHDCGASWQVDECSAGGEMLCSNCMARVSIGRNRARSAASLEGREPAVAEAPPGAEVVCPRCNLHFVPRPGTAALERAPRKTVLVVEEQEYFRDLAVEALSPGCEVRIAANLDEARAMLACGGIDLLVVDLTLEGGEGSPELLRSLDPKPCPILIVTAQDESAMYGEGWEELRRAGADDLLIKGMRVGDSLVRKAAALLELPIGEDGRIR
jgi:CheY-like chemotaxis protein